MSRLAWLVVLALAVAPPAGAQGPLPKPLLKDLKNLRFAAVGFDNDLYLSVAEHIDTGKILAYRAGKVEPFVGDLDDPRGLVFWKEWLFVAEERGILRIDRKGKVEVFAANDRFPTPPRHLMALVVDEAGTLYVADAGTFEGDEAAIFRIPKQGKITTITDPQRFPGLQCPWSIVFDGKEHLLVADRLSGKVSRVRLADGSAAKVADGLGDLGGLAWDRQGRLYITSQASPKHAEGRVFVIDRTGQPPRLLAKGFAAPTGLCLDQNGTRMFVADPLAGTLTALPTGK